MDLLDRIRQTRKADGPTPGRLRASASAERYQIPTAETVDKQVGLYAQLSWIQIATGITARSCAATPFQVTRNEKPIRRHPLEQLLMKPNPTQSGFEFWEATFAWRAVTGNAYWWLNTMDEASEPAEAFIIPANQIEPIPDGNMGVAGYSYDPGDGQREFLEAWEVLHFKTWNPASRYVGLSAIQAINIDGQADILGQRFTAGFYGKDNAKMGGVLAFADNIDDGPWERMQADVGEKHGGTKNKRILMLRNAGPGGVQWITTQLSQRDMQYLEQRRFTKEEIFEIFAPGLSSVLAINATEANSTAGKDTFQSMAVYPQHRAIAETIRSQLLPRYAGDDLDCAFEDVRRVDTEVELKQQEAYERSHDINEVRKKYYGDGPLPEGARTLAQGPVPPAPQAPPAGEEQIAQAGKALDRRWWKAKALKAILNDRLPDVPFEPAYLTDDEAMTIRAALKRARTAEDVAGVFKGEG